MKPLLTLLLAFACVFASGTTALTVIATGDLHGEILPSPDWTVPGEPKPELGGLARLATLVSAERARGPCLVLDAGDFLSGSPEAGRTRGMVMVELMNQVGYDAVAVGERDVPYLTEKLDTIARHARFRLLGERSLSLNANVDMPVTRPSLLKDVGGIKVGLVGLLDDQLLRQTAADSSLPVSGLTPEQVLEREVKALRSQNAELIIVLAHMPVERCRRLAAGHRDVALFLCSHEGLVIESALRSDSLPPVVEFGRRGQRVGICRIYLDSAQHSVLRIRSHVSNLLADRVLPDSSLAAAIERSLVPGMTDSVGFSPLELVPGTGSYSPLGQFVATSLQQTTGADAVILPFTVLDWALTKGLVTRRTVHRLLPFDEPLVRVRLDDSGIAGVLNEALSWNASHLPLVSGVSYDAVLADSVHPRARAVNVRVEHGAGDYDVFVTRALAVNAGLPSKSYRLVAETAAELLSQAIRAHGVDSSALQVPPVPVPLRTETGKVNINTATLEELKSLPGIGPSLAQRIIKYRQQTGSFRTIEDIMNVKGIKQGLFSRLKGKITV